MYQISALTDNFEFFYQMNPRVFPAINTVLTLTFGTVNKDIKSKRKFCRHSWPQ